MAVRSDSGLGLKVALVLFVFTTVAMLILCIVFYRSSLKEHEARVKAENSLEVYIEPREEGMDVYQRYRASAQAQAQSVAGYLHSQLQGAMQFFEGDPTLDVESAKAKFASLDVQPNEVVRLEFEDARRDLSARQAEVESLKVQLSSMDDEIAELEARLADADQGRQDEVDAIMAQISGYETQVEDYRRRLDDTVAELNLARERNANRYEGTIEELEGENDDLNQELVLMKGRVDELENILNNNRLRPQRPDELVDGRVIDSAGANDTVFIDRGRRNRIALGMTFEVYASPESIGIDAVNGQLSRGKASLQVIRVSETTATCKITRFNVSQPVVRNDVIANAVYDPEYKFKFLVHGKFDVDQNGVPSEAEAEFIRGQILEWGGDVIISETLPGDLDFLVLGVEPPMPPDLPPGATEQQISDWLRKREAHENYRRLFDQARDAQIPVLNANRFLVLTGYSGR
ncbi:MAG: hypothetical protein KC983_08875 [Phycisphaerales bacterium]|nr:hypothetical protein [Phycisphaerales bacterium]